MATENKAKKKSRGKSVILILLLIIVIAAAGGGYYLSTMNKALSPGSDKIILVEVASGDTTTAIADKLEEKGVSPARRNSASNPGCRETTESTKRASTR